MALIGIHRLKSHAALILDGLLRHLLGKLGEGFLALAAVILGVNADVQMFLAAAVDNVVCEVLYRVERLAAAADYRAHAAAGKLNVDSAVITRGNGDVRLDAHAV